MNFFLKKILNKISVYFFYLLKKNSRQYFFVLVLRKISATFNKSNKSKYKTSFILKWCEKKKIGLNNHSNFFLEKKSYYLSAKLKEKNLKYKMGGMAHLNLIYNLMKHFVPNNILETGVAFGWSTLVFILSKHKYSNLISIDLSSFKGIEKIRITIKK